MNLKSISCLISTFCIHPRIFSTIALWEFLFLSLLDVPVFLSDTRFSSHLWWAPHRDWVLSFEAEYLITSLLRTLDLSSLLSIFGCVETFSIKRMDYTEYPFCDEKWKNLGWGKTSLMPASELPSFFLIFASNIICLYFLFSCIFLNLMKFFSTHDHGCLLYPSC